MASSFEGLMHPICLAAAGQTRVRLETGPADTCAALSNAADRPRGATFELATQHRRTSRPVSPPWTGVAS